MVCLMFVLLKSKNINVIWAKQDLEWLVNVIIFDLLYSQAAQLTMVNVATAVVIMLTAENFEVASL